MRVIKHNSGVMKRVFNITACIIVVCIIFSSCKKESNNPLPLLNENTEYVIDHTCINLAAIPEEYINAAKENLRIAYGHTSHGSQLITGMEGLVDFKGSMYSFSFIPSNTKLTIHDQGMSGDLGNPDRFTWAQRTRDYIASNPEVNVIIWSWCGQVSTATEDDITDYLTLMQGLESDYPNVRFVYMTGHLDGTGLDGPLHKRNEQIRKFCNEKKRILYDFADIESYNPDGIYFGDKIPNDNCEYDSDNNGSRDANWALEWQNTHTEGTDWYECSSAHSQALNANQKAYAAWWLWAKLAGWDG